ncbi:hypothetical protein Lal_00026554 [Lupinus albus]|uniref:Putative transcription factor B3-Domain family n=1 Tax=Lupinus albus TaxID=3870 RepID=A0A6A4Q0U9_LUPAL|nr:putative transcription factor B3-Domain family [Lupinus albus]KAF1862037.1 hypothetical protein Lal_00026554 [Lupinus albus]
MASRRSSARVNFRASDSGAEVENPTPLLLLPDSTTNSDGGQVQSLSSELYFDVVLSKTHLSDGYRMGLPNNISSKLPLFEVPAVLNYRGKSWDIMYKGRSKIRKWFDCGGWKIFADDNCLNIGDACIFELMEYSNQKIVFKVQILRGNIPSKNHFGMRPDEPIVID